MNFKASHNLSQQEAKSRVEALGVAMNLTTAWESEYKAKAKGKVAGRDVSGDIEILPEIVSMNVNLPKMHKLVSRVVEKQVQHELEKALSND